LEIFPSGTVFWSNVCVNHVHGCVFTLLILYLDFFVSTIKHVTTLTSKFAASSLLSQSADFHFFRLILSQLIFFVAIGLKFSIILFYNFKVVVGGLCTENIVITRIFLHFATTSWRGDWEMLLFFDVLEVLLVELTMCCSCSAKICMPDC
jgi:hypothetical protein